MDLFERKVKELYNSGVSYQQFINNADIIDLERHFYYFKKMELSQREITTLMTIKQPKELLVFCDILCKDCRIVLAILKNMSVENENVKYRIVDREGNRDVMTRFNENCRIPMIIDISDKPKMIFNEFPYSILDKIPNLQQEEIDEIREAYRNGLYKEEVLVQIVTKLATD